MRAPTKSDAELLARVLGAEYVFISAEFKKLPLGCKNRRVDVDYDRSDRGKPRLSLISGGKPKLT